MFNKPGILSGYLVFDFNTKILLGNFPTLFKIRSFCIREAICPEDIIVYVQNPLGEELTQISQYAYPHTEIKFIGGIPTEVKSWDWYPQDIFIEKDIELSKWLIDQKNKIILFLHEVSEFLRLFL